MFIQVTDAPILFDENRSKLLGARKDAGALVSFEGLVREIGVENEVFTLEHYPGMTEKMLTRIANRAVERFELQDALIVHRVGEMKPQDVIVLVMAMSKHRQAAFDGANFMMDYLKTRAPFWKKEANGEWVDARSEDEDAFVRWGEEI